MSRDPEAGRPARLEGWSRTPLRASLPAILLVAAIGLAALVRPTAPLVFIAVLLGYLLARRSGRGASALAAVLPAAAILAWRALPQPIADPTGAQCADLLAPPALWRLIEAVIGLAAIVLLIRDRGTTAGALGFRRASRPVLLVSLVALVLLVPIALYSGVILGRGALGGLFWGAYSLDLSQPLAFLPAVVFAASNSLAEELAYRGAMRTWLVPSLGVVGANLAQAVVFGLSHTGDDFVSLEAAIPTAAAMVLVGFVGGVIVRRTRSLTLPLAIHAAADVPIYFYWACRVL